MFMIMLFLTSATGPKIATAIYKQAISPVQQKVVVTLEDKSVDEAWLTQEAYGPTHK
jgi:hypothetical protein